MNCFVLEEWRLDFDGVNSCSFLAANSSVAHSVSWLVHKNVNTGNTAVPKPLVRQESKRLRQIR